MSKSIKLNNDIYIDPGAIRSTVVYTSKEFTCTKADTFEYTGLDLVIPARTEFNLHFIEAYAESQPSGILVSVSNTAASPYQIRAFNNAAGSCSFSGYTMDEMHLYVWAKWINVGANRVDIRGIMHTYS